MKRCEFNWHSIFAYDDLEGTEAIDLPNKISTEIKRERVGLIMAHAIDQERKRYGCDSLEELQQFLIDKGKKLPILTNINNIFGGKQNASTTH